MGEYIYKGKIKSFLDNRKISFCAFWYKPYHGWDIPKWQKRFEGLIDVYNGRHPEGIHYITHTPCSPSDDLKTWDKNEVMPLYWTETPVPVVFSDYSKAYDRAFNSQHIIGKVWGTRQGAVKYAISIEDAKEMFFKQYQNPEAQWEQDKDALIDNYRKHSASLRVGEKLEVLI
jgi:hypothetical protein